MLGNTFSKNVIYQNHNHKNRMAIVRHWYLLLLLSAAGLCSCDGGRLSVVSSDFGTLSTGEQTTLYTLTNRSGAIQNKEDIQNAALAINKLGCKYSSQM